MNLRILELFSATFFESQLTMLSIFKLKHLEFRIVLNNYI